ncbi:uncharacterized protein LOC129052709 isoform X1 [Pongo abelii]|uniref:uncharacterized protein LOC129052709 isoform X1 n=1 Tax=Pongo abelii TaxID=9601 RepID=UPI0023E8E99D|nr:uncharacterized protein LOC129052709 isoform X1 [Pongo abelii]
MGNLCSCIRAPCGDAVQDFANEDAVEDISNEAAVHDISKEDAVEDNSNPDTVEDISNENAVYDIANEDTVQDICKKEDAASEPLTLENGTYFNLKTKFSWCVPRGAGEIDSRPLNFQDFKKHSCFHPHC